LTYEQFVLLLVLGVATAMALRAAMIWRLKTRRSHLWRELGAPSPMDFGLRHEASRRATGYLWKAKWLASDDPILLLIGAFNFIVAIGTAVLFWIQFVSGF
jgi:hypothetical protein